MTSTLVCLITTSVGREHLLFSRSLMSVLSQTRLPDAILVVVDDEGNYDRLALQLNDLNSDCPLVCIPNVRTRHMSGTGAWNTGIQYIAEHYGKQTLVAILDDDDTWDATYVEETIRYIEQQHARTCLSFLHRSDCPKPSAFLVPDLTVANFLVGNPGIQGSNMIFRARDLQEIGGFDESLASCTDRDLLIRYLEHFGTDGIVVNPHKRVNHFAGEGTLTYDPVRKNAGLDRFYELHMSRYTWSQLQDSLLRAEKLFSYPHREQVEKRWTGLRGGWAICVAMHDNQSVVGRCLQSIISQQDYSRTIDIVLADDNSSDDWRAELEKLSFPPSIRLHILSLCNNNTVRTRNDLHDYVRNRLPNVEWIMRLDADDYLASNDVLCRLEHVISEQHPDAILSGNYQSVNGVVTDFRNVATNQLLDLTYLRERVRQMSVGIAHAELPSCNLILRVPVAANYPDVRSGEDHMLLLHYLLHQHQYRVVCAEQILQTVYSIDGQLTKYNKKSEQYLATRRRMLAYVDVARLRFLGQGCEGTVLTDETMVYKSPYHAHFPSEMLCYTLPEVSVETYPYEQGEICHSYTEDEARSFLADAWRNRLLVRDCKPENFIRTSHGIVLIDHQFVPYTDNDFYNLCVRMFLYAHYYDRVDSALMRKMQRSCINSFEQPYLDGAREFVNSVFSLIIYRESESAFLPSEKPSSLLFEVVERLPSLEKYFYQSLRQGRYLRSVTPEQIELGEKGYFYPRQWRLNFLPLQPMQERVSLLIKTCPQDEQTIDVSIRHLVRQLSSPNPFCEVVVSVDQRTDYFIRQYYKNGTIDGLMTKLQTLLEDGVIDRIVSLPANEACALNQRWFALDCKQTHTKQNAPVSSQLYAFEQCQGDYILQCDSDCLVGRKDYTHSFLSDMIHQLQTHQEVLSVGFNIPNVESKDYFGFEDGGFVPEVRCCLFDKLRLLSHRPFPNEILSGNLNLHWHRSLQLYQQQHNLCSVRGGDNRTFFVHPQNFRKTNPRVWTDILDRVEQMQIPQLQYGHFDCEGSYYDWATPIRTESMVVLICMGNLSHERFLRMWYSLLSQTDQDFGIVLCDDAADIGLRYLIESLAAPIRHRLTYIHSRIPCARMENMYRALHYYVRNEDAIVVCLDGDDALIGKNVLTNVRAMYARGADMTIGRMHQTYRLQPHYRYPVDFVNPRAKGGNVWQHLKTFRMYLFHSIPLPYLHDHSRNGVFQSPWIPTCDDFAMMVPITEMASNPMQMDEICYYYERDYEHRNDGRELKERCIATILQRPSLSPEHIVRGRKAFMPTMDKIELDITYKCNLKCYGCNRSCGTVPTEERMTVEQIQEFIDESLAQNHQWKNINVLGGEPTLHPDFYAIIRLLYEYITQYSPDTVLKVVSNGLTVHSRELCEQVRSDFPGTLIDYGSYKSSPEVDYFSPFNDAPIDDPAFRNDDYSRACWVATYCGIGRNSSGYYGCAVCGGIDRVLRSNHAISNLADITPDKIREHYHLFCRYCGNYKDYAHNRGDFIPRAEKAPFREIISPTWQNIINSY